MNNCFRSKRYLLWVILLPLAFVLAGCGEKIKTEADLPVLDNETIVDTTPPAAPTALTATPVSSSRIDISWTASTDTDVSGYSVYRGTTKIATLTSTSYTDTGLSADTRYCYQAEAFDAAGNTSNKTIEACESTPPVVDTTPATLRVKVINDIDRSPISGATVVLGDSTGAMISYSTTDGNGEITFTDPPANATVTAALSSDNGTETFYSLKTLYDVNISEVAINLDKASPSLGTVNVNITNTIGADYWEVYGGDEYMVGDATDNPVAVNIGQPNIQSGGKVSFAAVGYDAGGNPIGYGTLTDQSFTDGMPVNIDINKTDLSTASFNISNIPLTAESFDGEVDMSRDGAVYIDPFWKNVLALVPANVTTHAIPGYGDLFRYDAWINMPDSAYHFLKDSATLGDQNIDWGTFPAIPSDLAIDNSGAARPTLSWNGSDPNADSVRLWVTYDTSSSSYRYSIEAPTTRISIVFPELPGDLAQFRPTWIDYFEAGNIETDIASGYDDSLVKYGQYAGGTITEYVMKLSWGYYPAALTSSRPGKAISSTHRKKGTGKVAGP